MRCQPEGVHKWHGEDVMRGAGGGRKVPLIGTWHAFVLECIFCSYLDAGPAGKTELCQEGERDREADREKDIEGDRYRKLRQLPFFLHVSCMLKYYPCRQKRATSFFKSLSAKSRAWLLSLSIPISRPGCQARSRPQLPLPNLPLPSPTLFI